MADNGRAEGLRADQALGPLDPVPRIGGGRTYLGLAA